MVKKKSVALFTLIALSPLFAEEESPLMEMETPIQRIEQPLVTAFSPFTGQIVGNKVRLRAQPTLEGFVVRETTAGELFACIGEAGDFYAVKPSKGSKGYVFRTFVLDDTIEGERVNIRLHPDMEAPIVGRLNAGEKVQPVVCATNPKWLEIDLPETSKYYISKEFIENVGPPSFLAERQQRHERALHLLSSNLAMARAEIQKTYQEIDLVGVRKKLEALQTEFSEFEDVQKSVAETLTSLEENYLQKKIAFLEAKNDKPSSPNYSYAPLSSPAVQGEQEVTDKMLMWKPLEESLYYLWAANNNKSMEEYYEEEKLNATILTGIVETYNRPVKNRPGDFLLRGESLPVAFLYSTRINLQEMVGKKVTLMAVPRPNNNFAFPAYFVISAE